MLSYKELFSEFKFSKNVISNLDILASRKVLNLNPYKDNNLHSYIKSDIKKNNTYEVPELINNNINYELFLLGICSDNNNIYHCILSILDEEYITNTDNIKNKDAEFFRLKLIADLDENYSTFKYIKEINKILNNDILVNNNIFLYLSLYLSKTIYIIENNNIFKYGDNYEKSIILLKKEYYYFPIINSIFKIFDSNELDNINKLSKLIEKISVTVSYNKMSLIQIQDIAKSKDIIITKKNKKGDKYIKKTKNDLIKEIESK